MQNLKKPARQLQRVKGVYMYSYCNVANCAGSGLNGYKHFMCVSMDAWPPTMWQPKVLPSFFDARTLAVRKPSLCL